MKPAPAPDGSTNWGRPTGGGAGRSADAGHFSTGPEGNPCPPPGCVQDNGMPCSATPRDLNAACARNPAICMWITHGGFGF
ncbi:hypothetical protein [Mycobacterium sp.]|uniref:hypothetical protein n=1 Tax=Mycobacterium sp. TaxID=1785 RepID=UPI003BB761ED